jgi:uracil-DNA glycosylase family 4
MNRGGSGRASGLVACAPPMDVSAEPNGPDLARAARLEAASLQAFGITELLVAARAVPAPPVQSEGAPPVHVSLAVPVARALPEVRPPAPVDSDLGAESPDVALARIAARIAACRNCGLAETRTKVVPGQGASRPRLALLGEAPGAQEDATGLAFVGAAGQLLTKMLAAMGLAREEVFILNVLKCRPPGNRTPEPTEIAACASYLEEQLQVLKPELIVALGGTAAHHLLQNDVSIRRLRGRFHDVGGRTILVTYHPSYLLQNPELKRDAWEDLKLAMAKLGLTGRASGADGAGSADRIGPADKDRPRPAP